MTSLQHEIQAAINEQERQQRRIAVAALAKLSIAFDKQMPDEQIDLYINMIYDLPSDALQKAVDEIIATERFFPAVATIRSVALSDDQLLSAEEAWAFICQRIQSGGRSAGTSGLTTEMKLGIDACGGWVALCESTRPDQDRYTFTKAYAHRTERNKRNNILPHGIPKQIATAIKQLGKGDL